MSDHPLLVCSADRGDGVDCLYLTDNGITARLIPSPSHGHMVTPRFSPDGRRVAYAAQFHPNGRFGLEIHDLSSGRTERLTSGDADDLMPTWSPDGGRLVWMRHTAVDLAHADAIEVWGLDLTDGVARQKTWNGVMDCYPAFTADGDAFLIERGPSDGPAGIVLTHWNGGETVLIDEPARSANGIPDVHGHYAVIERAAMGGEAWLFVPVLFDIRAPHHLVPLCDFAVAANPSPRFSPDGSRVAFHRPGRDGGAIGLSVVALDGIEGGVLNVVPREVAFVPDRGRQLMLPRWSQDGRLLAAQDAHLRRIVLTDTERNLRVMPAPGPARCQRFMEIWNFDVF